MLLPNGISHPKGGPDCDSHFHESSETPSCFWLTVRNFWAWFFLKMFYWLILERDRETLICYSTYSYIHWLLLVCRTRNLGIWGWRSNQLSYRPGLSLTFDKETEEELGIKVEEYLERNLFWKYIMMKYFRHRKAYRIMEWTSCLRKKTLKVFPRVFLPDRILSQLNRPPEFGAYRLRWILGEDQGCAVRWRWENV